MKLHGQKLVLPEVVAYNTFQLMRIGKRSGILFTNNEIEVYEALVLNHMDVISLPFLVAYRVNAECVDGITVGYFFEITSKKIQNEHNYFLVSSLTKSETNLETMRKSKLALDLRFKIHSIKLYSLGAEGVLGTCGFSEDVKQTLEL